MSHIIFRNGSKLNVPASKGNAVYDNFRYPENCTDEQIAFLQTIKAIYLNPHNESTPSSYIEDNWALIKPMVLAEWTVSLNGSPVRPATEWAWQMSKKYGLWSHGRADGSVFV